VQADAVALLALVAGQDVEPGDGPGQWRITGGTAPDRIISTVDPETRHGHKTRRAMRDGYKAHVAAEPDTGLITACDIGAGNVGDTDAAPGLIADEPAGSEILGDSAYSAGEFRNHLEARGMTPAIKPPPLTPAVAGGFTLDDFTIDPDARTVTCPENITVALTVSGTARFGSNCATCPVRARCTTATRGRVVRLHSHHDLLAAARRQAGTADFDTVYRQHRPMIERTIAWLVKDNHRWLRYRGIEANRLGWSHRCAAINRRIQTAPRRRPHPPQRRLGHRHELRGPIAVLGPVKGGTALRLESHLRDWLNPQRQLFGSDMTRGPPNDTPAAPTAPLAQQSPSRWPTPLLPRTLHQLRTHAR
jgi:hypothetical protein